jgi:hypothetical protein
LALTDFAEIMETKLQGPTPARCAAEIHDRFEQEINDIVDCLVTHSATVDELRGIYRRKIELCKLEMDPKQVFQILQIFEQVKDERQLSSMFGGADIEAVKEQIMVRSIY